MERVLLAGDWHGNRDFAADCFAEAAEKGCGAILQLGDFGLWPGREDDLLDHCARLASETATTLVWIDGNHENHDWLAGVRSKAGPDGLVTLRDRVQWATRGARWEWSARKFGALGGAVSLDRFLRRSGVNWWAREAPTTSDADRLGPEPLDVLATHAAPLGVDFGGKRLPLPPDIIEDTRAARAVLQSAVDRCHPELVVHGHHHLRYSTVIGATRVEGLAHDKSSTGGATVVLDVATLELVG